jgi:hypothetical protein
MHRNLSLPSSNISYIYLVLIKFMFEDKSIIMMHGRDKLRCIIENYLNMILLLLINNVILYLSSWLFDYENTG